MPDQRAVDLFAGPGGWDLAALALGLDVLGVEWDDAACATRRAAGLRTLQADVSLLDPADHGPVDGLIGSPPCPTFSRAGRGSGKHLTDIIVACLRALADGRDTRAEARDEAYETLLPIAWAAERKAAKKKGRDPDRAKAEAKARRDAVMSVLVVEPLRWVLALDPQWVALEQVPDVLPLWQVMAGLLERLGYSTWCGVLEAERYGVPQTRERAVLLARRDGVAEPPRPTHQRYEPKVPRLAGPEWTFDGEILPWVSMADALGWGATARPVVTVTAGGNRQGGQDALDGGSGARETMRRELRSGAWLPRPSAWPEHRPATTVAGDPRIFQPGGHHETGEQSENAVRVTVQEAAILQSFPADYPWEGDPANPNSRTAQFTQVGNAMPVLLAWHCLRAVISRDGAEIQEDQAPRSDHFVAPLRLRASARADS